MAPDGMKAWRGAQSLLEGSSSLWLYPPPLSSSEQNQHSHTCLMNGSFCLVYSAVETPESDSFCIQKGKRKIKAQRRSRSGVKATSTATPTSFFLADPTTKINSFFHFLSVSAACLCWSTSEQVLFVSRPPDLGQGLMTAARHTPSQPNRQKQRVYAISQRTVAV